MAGVRHLDPLLARAELLLASPRKPRAVSHEAVEESAYRRALLDLRAATAASSVASAPRWASAAGAPQQRGHRGYSLAAPSDDSASTGSCAPTDSDSGPPLPPEHRRQLVHAYRELQAVHALVQDRRTSLQQREEAVGARETAVAARERDLGEAVEERVRLEVAARCAGRAQAITNLTAEQERLASEAAGLRAGNAQLTQRAREADTRLQQARGELSTAKQALDTASRRLRNLQRLREQWQQERNKLLLATPDCARGDGECKPTAATPPRAPPDTSSGERQGKREATDSRGALAALCRVTVRLLLAQTRLPADGACDAQELLPALVAALPALLRCTDGASQAHVLGLCLWSLLSADTAAAAEARPPANRVRPSSLASTCRRLGELLYGRGMRPTRSSGGRRQATSTAAASSTASENPLHGDLLAPRLVASLVVLQSRPPVDRALPVMAQLRADLVAEPGATDLFLESQGMTVLRHCLSGASRPLRAASVDTLLTLTMSSEEIVVGRLCTPEWLRCLRGLLTGDSDRANVGLLEKLSVVLQKMSRDRAAARGLGRHGFRAAMRGVLEERGAAHEFLALNLRSALEHIAAAASASGAGAGAR